MEKQKMKTKDLMMKIKTVMKDQLIQIMEIGLGVAWEEKMGPKKRYWWLSK